MCVFEDCIQRYGPYFAWAHIEGDKEGITRPDTWTRAEMQQGLDNMNAFEMGYTMAFASLQSVVWRIFCRKMNCSMGISWIEARQIVETEMAAYEV